VLEGIRVLSFTHFLQGPSASQLLADLGADVIKIEPLTGAFERSWSGPDAYLDGVSVFFMIANRNVRSMSIDLRAPESAAVLDDLVATADVLIESFRPGAMARLGLDYERLSRLNPRLVYCSLSGYGSDGPYRDRPGQDVLLQALSGLAAANGRAGGPPVPAGASLVDQHAAVLGAFGVLAALHGRERTGKGTRVESNLLSAALDLQIEPLGYFLNGFTADRSASGVSSRYYKAPYGVFATADADVCLSLNSLETLRATFDDPWFAEVGEEASYARRDEVNQRVAAHLAGAPLAHWLEVFEAHGVWHAPVNQYADVVADPQVQYNRTTVSFEHPQAGTVTVLGHPVMYDGERPGVRTPPPALGGHTRDVLASLGYDDERIDALVAAGAIADGAARIAVSDA
jgi:crotonobetainyl-CoA:carnitine CoA-transferase CaiB-like acyl-CoA transferase